MSGDSDSKVNSKVDSLEEEGSGPQEIVQPVSVKELRNVRKVFRHHEGEPLTTWLLRCSDSGANNIVLDDRQLRRLGSLARDRGIDKALGSKNNASASGGDSCRL